MALKLYQSADSLLASLRHCGCELQCLTIPQSLGFEILACLYQCKVSTTSRILSALILAVLLRESRFSNVEGYPHLQLPGKVLEQLVELLNENTVLARPASTVLKSILQWQTAVESPVGYSERADQAPSVSPICSTYPDESPGSSDNPTFGKRTFKEGSPCQEMIDTSRPIKAAEAICAMPFLISSEAFCADSWRLQVGILVGLVSANQSGHWSSYGIDFHTRFVWGNSMVL